MAVIAAAALIAGLASAAALFRSGRLPWGGAPLRVLAIGHSWWWEFDYPDLGFKTANELHLPAGEPVRIELTSVDVLHALSIPELAVGAAAMPGQTNTFDLRVDQPGELGGACTEICGTAHNMMQLKVIVQSDPDFDAWAAHQKSPAAAPQSIEERAGYEMVTTACARCHSLDPAELRSDLPGPNLAHLMSRSVFAGASFTLNETNLRRWLRDTQAMKAGNDMQIQLLRDDYESVVKYLLTLK